MALDFFAGCLGGCAGVMVGYPLDTIKVHMQTQDYRNPKYTGNWHCFRTILQTESVTGLYRGMTSPLAGVALVNAIIFGIYGQTQRRLSDPDSLSSHFIAGVLAGIAQSPICSPIELAKTRMQLQASSVQFSGPVQCLKHVYKCEGYRGVFRGFPITVLREVPSFGVYFLTYEALTKTVGNIPVSTPYMLIAGGLAGTTSWVVSYPLDVVKSRIQADSNRYTGSFNCFKESVKAEGYSCLYRGLSSTILRAFPTNAVTFTVVTWTFRIFGGKADESSKTEEKSTLIESVKNVTEDYFLEKWNPFLIILSSKIMIPKLRYSTLPLIPKRDLLLENCVLCREWSKNGVEYNVVEQSQEDENKKCVSKEARERERSTHDESKENKTEWWYDEQVTTERDVSIPCVINDFDFDSEFVTPGELFFTTNKNM